MAEEIWKPIWDTYPYYQVSNLGRFRKYQNGKETFIPVWIRQEGNPVVTLFRKRYYAMNLVASKFLPDPGEGAHTAVPKNNDLNDLRADNLEWVEGYVNVFDYCIDRGRVKFHSRVCHG